MEIRVGEVVVSYVEHGAGRTVLVLHGAGVDHREAEACFEPVFDGVAGVGRGYPHLPGPGRAPGSRSSVPYRRACATSRSTGSSPVRVRSVTMTSAATS